MTIDREIVVRSLPLLVLAAHMLGEYLLQTDWMAENKLRDWRVRAVHVSLYTLAFAPFTFVWLDRRPALLFLALVWVTHFITDSRRWASGERWPLKPLAVDQSIHIVTLALLVLGFEAAANQT